MGELVYKYDSPTTQDPSQLPLRLTCVCAPQSFSYAIESIGDDSVLHLRTSVFDRKYHLFSEPLGFLEQAMKEDQMLYERFDQKMLLLRGLPFSIAKPGSEGSDDVITHASEPVDNGRNDRLLADRSETFKTLVKYAVPDVFMREVSLYFRGTEVRHSISGLICSTYHVRNHDVSCIVQISAQWVEVVIVDHSRLAFANHYRWYDSEDIVYFLAAGIEQSGLDQMHFVFFGSHCDNVIIERIKSAFELTDGAFDHMQSPKTRLMDLSALAVCE